MGFALTVTALGSRATPGDVDLLFDPGSTIDGQVRACAVQPDGKVIIGGDFKTLHAAVRGKIARLSTDGHTDETFLYGLTGVDGDGFVQCLAFQPDGKVIIGGGFNSINGATRTNLARLNSDGSLDTNFLSTFSGPDGEVDTMILQADGKILIAGAFASVNGVVRIGLARLNSDGSLDENFNVLLVDDSDPLNAQSGYARAFAVQDDRKILVAGGFTRVNNLACTNLVRLNENGTADPGFSASLTCFDGLGDVACVTMQTNHQILVGGSFTLVNGLARTNLVRLNADGSLDESFNCPQLDSANGEPYQIVTRPDGKLIVLGPFTPDGVEWWGVALLNTNGPLDTTFANSFSNGAPNVVALQADGKVFAGGAFEEVAGTARRSIARLNPDCSLDTSFDNGGPIGIDSSLESVAVQADGKILVGGPSLYSVNGQTHLGFARLNSDGSLDDSLTTVVGGGFPSLDSILVQGDGKILLAGRFESVNGASRSGLARLRPDGILDESFLNGLSGADAEILDVAIQTNGQILAAGYFKNFNDQTRYGLARLNPDGTLESGFANEFFGMPVRKLALQADGKILIASEWGLYQLRRANSDGTADTSFSMQVQGTIYDMLIQPDGKILLGGFFDLFHGQSNNCLVRLNADGTLDSAFLAAFFETSSYIYRLAIQEDGKIVVMGNFGTVNGVTRSGLARFLPDGLLDADFNPDLHQGVPEGIALQSDGKILACGWFSAVNQSARANVVRLMGNCVPPSIRSAPQSSTAENGANASLGTAASGYPAPQYQWYFNSTNVIAGATNRLLRLDDVQFAESGNYLVVVSNSGGVVTSAPVALSVIAAVERRAVPALRLTGIPGSTLNLEWTDGLLATFGWSPLATVKLSADSQYQFDTSLPLPPQRFYRAWQSGAPAVAPALHLDFAPALTLAGVPGSSVRVDGINAVGPTDAWFTLDTVVLTNSTQLYFDPSAIRQPTRLYRLIPVP